MAREMAEKHLGRACRKCTVVRELLRQADHGRGFGLIFRSLLGCIKIKGGLNIIVHIASF